MTVVRLECIYTVSTGLLCFVESPVSYFDQKVFILGVSRESSNTYTYAEFHLLIVGSKFSFGDIFS